MTSSPWQGGSFAAHTTLAASQKKISVQVYQGESDDPSENLNIGEFMVTGLSDVPAGNEIIVQFHIDLNGLLTATAIEKRTGLAKSVTIDTAGHHRINLDAARTNLAALFAEQDAFSENDEESDDSKHDVIIPWTAGETPLPSALENEAPANSTALLALSDLLFYLED